MKPTTQQSETRVIRDLREFDRQSGSWAERILFNNRLIVIVICAILTAIFGYQAARIPVNASFERMIPTSHPYIINYLEHKGELRGLGNVIRIAVENRKGTIYDAHYLDTVRKINDEVFLLPGVDRPFMKSLWTPSTRWLAVTEQGLDGGAVMPDSYDGSAASLAQVRSNIDRTSEVGQLVAPDFRSSVIYVPLQEIDPQTGKQLDYATLSQGLEKIRAKYQDAGISIHVTGFAKIAGDMIAGLHQVLAFFCVAIAIATAMLYWYTRCARSTALVVLCSLVAVVWQLGLVTMLHFQLDPYSILVPFLVFAIGMSHGAQKMNGIMQDVGRGTHKLVAARYTYRRLFLAGLTALLCDAIGFAVLIVVRIKTIQDLALIASLGVGVLIFTNLILLPILLSYFGVNRQAALRALKNDAPQDGLEAAPPGTVGRLLDRFTRPAGAGIAIVAFAAFGAVGYVASLNLKIGDLDRGAPELRANSRYNRDSAFMNAHYAASSDVFVVMATTPAGRCSNYGALRTLDALEWELRQQPGVASTVSLASQARSLSVGMNEGNPKWYELVRTQSMLNAITLRVPPEVFNSQCDMLGMFVYLKDHKADTLAHVSEVAQSFIDTHPSKDVTLLLAAGSAGIDAATNQVVRQASHEMLLWVYAAVVVLCLIAFRSWRAVVCAVVPLMLTSILAEALMVWLNMGVKVATLPVIALGVGIGVDYALYVMTIVLARMRAGASLSQAYAAALQFTGKVVMFTGFTLAAGVATWIFSPIRFQADMGLLLAFMFLWNMLGALVLLPALACFLLRKSPIRAVSGLSQTTP
ncbi:MMPL family transporter [Paraburkholderia sediminicola]|uniref:efflux RND transporter permease subunit n=1 Tax=Paraburkholderia sediminicola TaxID=458836 RepID=UPI0038B91AAB